MAKTKINTIPLSSLKPNKDNPRIIKDEKFAQLVKSLQEFPEMMEKRPITIDSWAKPVVLGGNMRLKALAHAGYKEIPKAWVQSCEGWTEAQKKQFLQRQGARLPSQQIKTLTEPDSKGVTKQQCLKRLQQ